jgi:hypothetical protein
MDHYRNSKWGIEMGKPIAVMMLLAFLPATVTPVPGVEMTGTNYRITATVISGAGGPMSSASYRSDSTLGQPSPLMAALVQPVSESYALYPGFWYAVGPRGTVSDEDSDGDGIKDGIEIPGCTDHQDVDSDNDGIRDGVEDADRDGVLDAGETDPCNWDTDKDGLADGEEDVNANGIRDPGELDPLDDDCDDDGYADGVEKAIGTQPLNGDSWPWIICIGACDLLCDDCAADVSTAMHMISETAPINYLRVREDRIDEGEVDIPNTVLIGIESGRIVLQTY